MPGHFGYPCPDCRSRNNLHEPDCRFTDRKAHEVEQAYVEVLAQLSSEPTREADLQDELPRWSALHVAALRRLRDDERVKEDDSGNLAVVPPAERKERLKEPTYEPLATIYRKGSVPGALDNSVFAMVAFYEMVGFTWPETKRLVIEWLHETGTWERGDWEESTPEQLLESKRHVYEQGYGWKEKAKAAKGVIERNL